MQSAVLCMLGLKTSIRKDRLASRRASAGALAEEVQSASPAKESWSAVQASEGHPQPGRAIVWLAPGDVRPKNTSLIVSAKRLNAVGASIGKLMTSEEP